MAQHSRDHDDELDRLYFAGINADWKLLASTKHNALLRTDDPMEPLALKSLSCVGAHAIVGLWDTLAHSISPLNTENAWLTMGCYRIGHGSVAGVKPVVVLLCVKPDKLSASDGEALAAQILVEYASLLRQTGLQNLPTEITVEIAEIQPCSTSDNNDNAVEKGIPSAGPPYSQNAHPGSSVGRRDSSSSGSIGAFFAAKLNNGATTKILLTNHHVACPGQKDPFPPHWDSASSQNILSPSPQDLKATHKYSEKAIGSLNARIGRLRERNAIQLTIAGRQELDSNVLGLEAEIQFHYNALPTLMQENTMWALASLSQTSGWSSDRDAYQMDWAIATLIKDITSPNRLPEWTFTSRERFLQLEVESNFPNPFPSSITDISRVPLQAEDMVIKYGRTTGWTLGVVNGCGTYHFEWHAAGETSKSISIVGYGGVLFCDKGDSGSMILNTKGEAAALLFATSVTAQESVKGLTFAADIGAILADIELRTPLKDLKLLS